jgi:hypothetical protein
MNVRRCSVPEAPVKKEDMHSFYPHELGMNRTRDFIYVAERDEDDMQRHLDRTPSSAVHAGWLRGAVRINLTTTNA